MSLIYIEFISRRPGVALEAVKSLAGGGQEGGAGDNDDQNPQLKHRPCSTSAVRGAWGPSPST